jgi:uncharacterized protein (TIGR02996 family)
MAKKKKPSSDETPFLTAIDAEPAGRTARLIYADWLEERGDSRGELIRIGFSDFSPQ